MGLPAMLLVAAITSVAAASAPPLTFPRFTAGFQGLMQRSVPANGHLAPKAASMPGEATQMLAAANFVRDNIVWSDVETQKGIYNFSHTDALLAEYDAAGGGIRWMATLAYSNPLYGPGPPASAEGVAAFVKFTVAAVRQYRGRGVLWELWCEPNGAFWDGGSGNVTQYVALARAVGAGVAAAGLGDEFFIGPNSAMWWSYDVDLPFLEACLQGGVLEYWSAINLHLYRATAPETAQDTYRKTRALVRKYLPAGAPMPPLISGEWGYADCVAPCGYYPYTGQVDTQTQAKYLARQWLVNSKRLLIWWITCLAHSLLTSHCGGDSAGGRAIHLVQVPQRHRRPNQHGRPARRRAIGLPHASDAPRPQACLPRGAGFARASPRRGVPRPRQRQLRQGSRGRAGAGRLARAGGGRGHEPPCRPAAGRHLDHGLLRPANGDRRLRPLRPRVRARHALLLLRC